MLWTHVNPSLGRGETELMSELNHGMLLEGIFAAVTTCFYPDGRPYWRKLEQMLIATPARR